MCPCHAEHLIDQKLLKSDRLTERIRLWSQFNITEADFGRIKRQFFERCRRCCPGDDIRYFSTVPSHIPEEIVSIYNQPNHEMPSLNESLNESDVCIFFSVLIDLYILSRCAYNKENQ